MARDWQQLILSSIPLACAMQVSVNAEAGADGAVILTAPLVPNLNDKGTAFGGSVATLATIAGWVEVRRQLDCAGVGDSVDIVIQRGATEYLSPITGDFCAVVRLAESAALERFWRTFMRRHLGRLAVSVDIECAGIPCARFNGEYVAVLV